MWHWRHLNYGDGERQKSVLVSNVEIQASLTTFPNDMQGLMIEGAIEESQTLEAVLSSLHEPIQRMSDTLIEYKLMIFYVLRWLSAVSYQQHHKACINDVLEKSGE